MAVESRQPASSSCRPRVGEYSRAKLTPDQERLFAAEVDKWVDEGWLVPHDEDVHRPPAGVLPVIAQVEEHKASMPVQPCLDYRCLNDLLTSQPGRSAPVCEDTLCKWRRAGDPGEMRLLDIRKA